MKPELVKDFDLTRRAFPEYGKVAAATVVLSTIGGQQRLPAQLRTADAAVAPSMYNNFGSRREAGETVLEAAVRELKEETGAIADPKEMIFLGFTQRLYFNLTRLGGVARFFWHDQSGQITGTNEGDFASFATATELLKKPNITFGSRAAWQEALKRGFLPA